MKYRGTEHTCVVHRKLKSVMNLGFHSTKLIKKGGESIVEILDLPLPNLKSLLLIVFQKIKNENKKL
ncbi:hypothetical protein RJT34_24274 [Clitoria ternatea]|uniref:Uncharacterized protein n=1 Tax=Clitoria ternatea TaxID=43366 RepID=A0AAN9FW43_CLITE